MRKFLAGILAMSFAVALSAGVAGAKDMTNMKGVGWFDFAAPVGGIIWLNEKIGVTAGVGFAKPDEGDTQFRLAGGIPIVLVSTDMANFEFRPGILFKNKGFSEDTGSAIDNEFSVRADLVAEFFIADRASIQASHGAEFVSTSPAGDNADSFTTFRSRAVSLTSVGFYFYFMK